MMFNVWCVGWVSGIWKGSFTNKPTVLDAKASPRPRTVRCKLKSARQTFCQVTRSPFIIHASHPAPRDIAQRLWCCQCSQNVGKCPWPPGDNRETMAISEISNKDLTLQAVFEVLCPIPK